VAKGAPPDSGEPKMQIPILIEAIEGNGYRARGPEPFALTAEGHTREEALAKLTDQMQARMKAGATIVPLDVPAGQHPLAQFAGMFKDDEDFREVVEIMAENQRNMNAVSNIP
jgi:hypothetical protein